MSPQGVVLTFCQVFYAPHIAALSSTLGTRFQPIRYILQGDAIASNVFYSSSVAQVPTRALFSHDPAVASQGSGQVQMFVQVCDTSLLLRKAG